MLCDRIVCGVKSNELRNRLLRTPELTLNRCLEICRLSEFDAAQLGGNSASHEDHVNAITRTTRTPAQSCAGAWGGTRPSTSNQCIQCSRCGYNHVIGSCPAKGKQCAKCKLIGHFSKVCKTKRPSTTPFDEMEVEENNQPGEIEMECNELFVGIITNETTKSVWYENIV